MTIPVPKYAARNKLTFKLWHWNYRFRRYRQSLKRNPDCNENRRYRDDTQFVAGEHTHKGTWSVPGYPGTGEIISVPFKPMRFDGPTYKNGLTLSTSDDSLSNWNWFDTATVVNEDE